MTNAEYIAAAATRPVTQYTVIRSDADGECAVCRQWLRWINYECAGCRATLCDRCEADGEYCPACELRGAEEANHD